MRLVRPTRKACDRARLYASARLDGELSELEDRLLAAHLEQCPPCRGFGADGEAFTAALRAASLEPVPQPAPVRWRARRSLSFRPLQAGAAALVLAAIGLGGVLGVTPTAREQQPSSTTSPTSGTVPARYDSLLRQDRSVFTRRYWTPSGGWASRPL